MEDRSSANSLVVFNPSAFKHHETEADIYLAIETKIYEGRMKARKGVIAQLDRLNGG